MTYNLRWHKMNNIRGFVARATGDRFAVCFRDGAARAFKPENLYDIESQDLGSDEEGDYSDYNVDLLAAFAEGPWLSPARQAHHAERRDLRAVSDSLGIDVQLPEIGCHFDGGNLPSRLVEESPEGSLTPLASRPHDNIPYP